MVDPAQRRSGLDLYAAALAGLLPLAYSPSVGTAFLSPKSAVLLTAIPVGLVLLVISGTARADAAARAGAAFIFVALAATAFAGVPHLAFFGNYDQMTGWLFIAGSMACWAIGRHMTRRGTALLVSALTSAFVVSAAIAVTQHLIDLSVLGLGLQFSRSTALAGNPVHAGAFFAGIGVMATVAARTGRRWWLVSLFVCGIATQAAGSRLGVVVLGGAVLLEVFRRRDPRAGLALACVAAGLVAGQFIVATGTGQSGTTRVAGGVVEQSTTARLHSWTSLPQIVMEKPLLGWGPGRYGIASERHKPVALVRSGGDRVFVDAHNLFVEYAATTGMLGLAALVGFLVLATRGAGGPLAGFAVGVFALMLVQPLNPATAPLAALALGAATPRARTLPWPWSRRVLVGAGSVIATAAATALLVGDSRVAKVRLDYEPDDFVAAHRMLPDWPDLYYEESLMWVFLAESEDRMDLYGRAVEARRRAIAADPESARPYNHLGAIQLKVGETIAARASFEAAIERAPRFAAPHVGVARAELAAGRIGEARRAVDAAEKLLGRDTQELRQLRRAIDEASN